MMEINAQRAPRVPYEAEAIVYLRNSQLICRSANISTSGMLLYAPAAGRPGEFLRVVFALPGSREMLDADALLVREARESPAYAWGVQFLQNTPQLSTELTHFVNRRLEEETKKIRLHKKNCEANKNSEQAGKTSAPTLLPANSTSPAHLDAGGLARNVLNHGRALSERIVPVATAATSKNLPQKNEDDPLENAGADTPLRELYRQALRQIGSPPSKKR